ncbi:MAG: ABC transporter substrate-binding protein [Candidatus Omnitrophica bacterium]|nr:ABC transporter substrate-binding protein [Candidatus Omnitrophota bacterium]
MKTSESPPFRITPTTCREKLTRVLVALVFCLCLGCHRDDVAPDGRIHLTYWEKWTGFEFEAMKKVVEMFNASQDRIYVDLLSISQNERKVIVAIAGGNPPDVAGITSEFVPVLVQMNALYPLDGYLERAGIDGSQDFIDSYWRVCNYEGCTWALPTTGAALAYHYNKKAFRKKGLDPENPPRSLEELEALDPLLNDYTNDRILHATFLPSEPDWWPFVWPMFFGGKLWDGKRTITLTSPEVVEAYEWVASYSDRLGVERAQAFRGGFGDLFASPQNLFLSGKLYSELQGLWMDTFVQKYSPDLEYGVAPMPTKTEDLYGVSLVECDIIFIPRGSRHPNEAFEFMKFVTGQTGAETFTTGMRSINPRKVRSEGYIENHPHPHIEFFDSLAMSDKAQASPRISMWYEMLDEMKAVFDKVWLHKGEPYDILKAAEVRMQERLDQDMDRWESVRDVRKESWEEFIEKTRKGEDPL